MKWIGNRRRETINSHNFIKRACISPVHRKVNEMNRSLIRMGNTNFDNPFLAKFVIFGEPFRTIVIFIDREVVGSKSGPSNEK
jgi:hypothetical protein